MAANKAAPKEIEIARKFLSEEYVQLLIPFAFLTKIFYELYYTH